MFSIPRVALLIESSRSYGRGILRGLADFVKTEGPWSIFREERSLGDVAPRSVLAWKPDGIIARIENPRMVRQVRRLGVATIDLFARFDLKGVPAFDDDDREIARLAAGHLVERGFRQFAFCGLPGVHYSDNRCRWFREALSNEGFSVHIYIYNPGEQGPSLTALAELTAVNELEHMAKWIRSLPKPIGVMASNDVRAQHLLRVCTDAGILVPEEVAVIGVDNDDAVCELCFPSLTSIEPDTRRMGFEAARTLSAMLRGESIEPAKQLVSPSGVVARKSTDVLATADRATSEALRLIRDQACSGRSPQAILGQLRVSRSTLERRFREQVGRSPKAELERLRVERGCELLLRTNLTLPVVAKKLGYEWSETFQRQFRNWMGLSPGEFRRHRQPRAR